jgi:hypothetical protein
MPNRRRGGAPRFADGLPETSGPGYDGVAMPSARPSVVEGLAVEEVRDGLTVFDPATDRVHYLNATAAIVFSLCDGTHTASEIASVVAQSFELHEPPGEEIEDCLSMLRSERLLR